MAGHEHRETESWGAEQRPTDPVGGDCYVYLVTPCAPGGPEAPGPEISCCISFFSLPRMGRWEEAGLPRAASSGFRNKKKK